MSSEKILCEFCNNEFTNKVVLRTHQRRTKYCLAIQQNTENHVVIEELTECEYCLLKVDVTKLQRHQDTCRAKLLHQIKQKDDLIQMLREHKDKQVGELKQEIAGLRAEIKIYKQMQTKNIRLPNVRKKHISIQTDPVPSRMDLFNKMRDQVKNQEIELEKLRSAPGSSKQSEVVQELRDRVKELENQLEKYQKQTVSNSEITVVNPTSRLKTLRATENRVIMIGEFPITTRSSDGYVNLTELVRAAKEITGRKRRDYDQWRKQADGFLEALFRATQIPVAELIYVSAGFKTGRVNEDTYGHPLIAIDMSAWLDHNIGVQYMAWVFELKLRGSVTLGQEHTIQENVAFYQEQIAQLTNTNTEITNKLQDIMVEHSNLIKTHKLLNKNHQLILKKRQYHEFKKGKCMYVCHRPGDDNVKVGISGDVNQCLYSYRRLIPRLKIRFLVYFDPNTLVESMFKFKHADELLEPNHEVYTMTPEIAISSITETLITYKIPHTIESDIVLYND